MADLLRERNRDLERILATANEIGVDTSGVDIHYSIYGIPSIHPSQVLQP